MPPMPAAFDRFQLRKRLLKLTGGEGLFDIMPRGCTSGSFKASEIHDYLPGVFIIWAIADLRVIVSECFCP